MPGGRAPSRPRRPRVAQVLVLSAWLLGLGGNGGCGSHATSLPRNHPEIVAILEDMPDWENMGMNPESQTIAASLGQTELKRQWQQLLAEFRSHRGLPVASDPFKAPYPVDPELRRQFKEATHACRPQIEEIERRMALIAAYDLDSIRHAMAYYYDHSTSSTGQVSSRAECTLFLLDKYLFDLPNRIRRDAPGARTFGYLDPEPRGGEEPAEALNLRWPWEVDTKGRYRLTGFHPLAGLTGSILVPLKQYHPLEAFDYYRQHYGRRSIEVSPEGAAP